MTDALILGGGLAGSAAACLIGSAGTNVRLIERETEPHHKVCGEFLSVEAVTHLRQMGVDPIAFGAAPIERIRLVRGRVEAEAALPFKALGLSRYVLDEALINQAEANGARIERGVRVLELKGRTARTSSGEREGRQVLLATGKLPIRESSKGLPVGNASGFVGLKMHYRLAPPAARRLAGTIVLVLLDGGYAGLQMIEAERANLCLILGRQAFAKFGGGWQALRSWLDEEPYLRQMLQDAEPLFERPVAIGNLQYAIRPRQHSGGTTMFLGDRWAMTAPLTGDGMAIALRSAFVAARCVNAGDDAKTYNCKLASQTSRQIARAIALQSGLNLPYLGLAACWLARIHPPLLSHAAHATRLPAWNDPRHSP